MSDNEEDEQQRRKRSCTVIMTNSNATTTSSNEQKDQPEIRRTGSMRRRLSKQNATLEEPTTNNANSSTTSSPIREEEEASRPALQRVDAIVGDDDTKLRPPGALAKHAWSASKSLSRESNATDFSDRSGIDLRQFIRRTMHKSEEDREQLLYFERIMIELIENGDAQSQKFELPSSYHRMLLHRCAAWFGLDHNVTNRHTEIVINKSEKTKIPDDKFADFIMNNDFMEGKFTRHNSSNNNSGVNSPRREYGSHSDLLASRRAQSFDVYSSPPVVAAASPTQFLHHHHHHHQLPPPPMHAMRQLSLQCSTPPLPPPQQQFANAASLSGGNARMWTQRSFDCSPQQHHHGAMMRKAESYGNMGAPSVMVHHYHHCYEEPPVYHHHHECSPSYYTPPPPQQTFVAPPPPPPQATVYYPVPYATPQFHLQPELIVNDPEPFPRVEQFVVDQGYQSKHQAQTANSFIKASIDGGYGSMNQEVETSSSSRESATTAATAGEEDAPKS